jgi:hypothetical protein
MKFKYIIEHTYSYKKEFEIHSDKELDESEIISLCCSHQDKDFKSDNLMVESFDDELLDNNEWDIKKEIL